MSAVDSAPPRTRRPNSNNNRQSNRANQNGSNKRNQGNNSNNRSNHQRNNANNSLRHAGKVHDEHLSATQKRRRPSDNDLALLLKSTALIGQGSVSTHMAPYMFDAVLCQRLKNDYVERMKNSRNARQMLNIVDTVDATFDLHKTWNNLNLAAVLLASVVDPATQILFVASNESAGKGASRVASYLKAQSIIGRYVPGTLSNPAQKTFIEPTWIVCASATEDVQAIKESASSNTAVIAFCDSTSNLTNIDVPIGCNTRSRLGIGLMFYFLLRQTLRHKGIIPYDSEIEGLMVDHFIQQRNKKEGEEEVEEVAADQQEQVDAQSTDLRMDAGQVNNDANWDENFN